MTLQEFVEMCKARDWPTLINFLSSDIKDLSTKIVVSSIIQHYHPDKLIAAKYGLESCWNDKLSSDVVPPMLSMMLNKVDLSDFAKAYLFAEAEAILNDKALSLEIKKYVIGQRIILGQFLQSPTASDSDKAIIIKVFGDMKPTKEERESYNKKSFMMAAKEKIACIQAIDQIPIYLASIFNLKPEHIRVHYTIETKKFISRGVIFDDGHIYFKGKLSIEAIRKYAQILKGMSLSVHFFNFPSYFGMQTGIKLDDHPAVVVEQLAKFASNKDESTTNPEITFKL